MTKAERRRLRIQQNPAQNYTVVIGANALTDTTRPLPYIKPKPSPDKIGLDVATKPDIPVFYGRKMFRDQ